MCVSSIQYHFDWPTPNLAQHTPPRTLICSKWINLTGRGIHVSVFSSYCQPRATQQQTHHRSPTWAKFSLLQEPPNVGNWVRHLISLELSVLHTYIQCGTVQTHTRLYVNMRAKTPSPQSVAVTLQISPMLFSLLWVAPNLFSVVLVNSARCLPTSPSPSLCSFLCNTADCTQYCTIHYTVKVCILL